MDFRAEGLAVDCEPEQNICIKAFRLMHDRYGVDGVAIRLDKRVPFGAGLGGGSSDGTAVLLALDRLFDLHLPEAELIARAAELGSDTPFFVRNSPQFCTGRGEIMSPFPLDLAGLTLVIVKPDEGVSTREAYAGVRPWVPSVPLAERLRRPVAEWQEIVTNDFEPHIFAAHPAIRTSKRNLLDAGALYASMSGSGSAGFRTVRPSRKSREPAVADSLHLFVVGVARSWADVIPALAGALPGWPCAQAASGFPCFCRNVCCICGSSYPSIRTCCIRCPRIASVLSAWPLPLSHPLSSAPVRIASMVARMALVRIASVLPAFVSDPQASPDRLFFSRDAAGYGHLLDAVLVASAFELRREVGVEHRHGLVVGDEAGREDDNVGVVVTADEPMRSPVPTPVRRGCP